MDDELFELEYADELDALDECDYEPPISSAPKSKRSLQFENQVRKNKGSLSQNTLSSSNNDDFFDDVLQYSSDEGAQSQPISSLRPGNNSVAADFDKDTRTEVGDNFKRKRGLLESWDDVDEVDSIDGLIESSIAQQKRLKLTKEQEADQNLLQQILEQRTSSHQEVAHSRLVNQVRQNDGDDVERHRVLKHIPHCDFISARSYDGRSVYMKLWDKDVLESDYCTLASNSRSSGLPVPVGILLDQIQMQQIEAEKTVSERIVDVIECVSTEQSVEMSTTDVDDNRLADDVDEVTAGLKSLWVEKYAPRKYTELLSEEAVNRSLLHWIKLWDYVVFDKEVPKVKKKDKNAENKKFKRKNEPDILESLDKYNRPQQKVALLCGPPGLGKTTLAHIVARHAGYNVVEMNASDDRTADVFRNKIESATQMKAVMGADPSPNCLVIDEIDGAPPAAINVLLNMIKKSEGTNEKNTKRNREGGILRRPIICICNDQYVPALRQLRQISLLLNFPQTEASRLASRLYEVIQIEELKADINTLLALCERTDNDIRACLNTLQFVRQKQKELSLQTVRTMSVGQKDSQKSFFSVWQSVFSMPREKKNRFISVQDLAEGNQSSLKGNNLTPQARFQHVLQMVQSAGEYDRIMQGLFENYLSAKCKDPRLSGLCLANDWFGFVDELNLYLAKSQDYSVARYMSFLPVLFHFLYASYTPQRLIFPQSQNEATQKITKTKNLLNTMIADMSPMVRKFINPIEIVLDLLSPLVDILQPTLRPVNTLLYSNREKEELTNVVHIMIAYNMTYRQEKTMEGQYVYALDPNVEEIVQFPDLKQRKQLTYAAKQLIAREIELEKMRRNEGFKPEDHTNSMNAKPAADVNTSSSKLAGNGKVSNEEKMDTEKSDNAVVPNHLRKLEAKKIAGSDKPSVNFFEKFKRTKREKSTKPTESSEKAEDKDKSKLLDSVIWFHFKEGYSNAVRKTVKISDLL